ncbi:MAG TPA: PQQ-binding-like beta-propeller repeat protein [Candidatus Nanoarchaeia archaeon]|nr:PQQ-binding-like beta-propeller repeat protein [Candidatus Nanoarchaeia archaeon]
MSAENFRNKRNGKSIFVAVALILLLSVSALAIGAQSVQAQSSQSAIYMFVTATQAGLNQNIQVVAFMSSVTPDAVENTGSRWHNVTVTITKPDGTTDTKFFPSLDAVASGFFFYTATELGNYTFQASFPGQTIQPFFNPLGLSSSVPIVYGPAQSLPTTVTVTQAQVAAPNTTTPLPTTYWQRPVNALNYNWYQITSNWLLPGWDYAGRQFDQGSAYDRSTKAPNSAHILWTSPLTFGGLTGGEFGATDFYNGMSYEQYFKPPVIISGRLYYNTIVGQEPTAITNTGVNTYTTVDQESQSSVTCVSLSTGKTIMTIPEASISFGQIYNYISPNQGGTYAYLWDTNGPGGTWKMYDAWTGQYILSIANVPTGTMVLDNFWGGPGNILIYTLDNTKGTLSLWNSSAVLNPRTTAALNPGLAAAGLLALVGVNPFTYRPENYMGLTFNGTGITNLGGGLIADTNGIEWTVPLTGFAALNASGTPTIEQTGYDNTVWVMAGNGPTGAVFSLPPYETWASYKMSDGSVLSPPVTINMLTKIPLNGTAYDGVNMPRIIDDNGNFAIYNKESLSMYSWNVKTGAFNWGPVQASTNGWALYNWETDFVADNVVYNWGFDGMIHAFDTATGKNNWNFDAGTAGSLNPYGVNALYQGLLIADGKIYAQTGDHGNGAQPLYQGEYLYCLDKNSGQNLWTMPGWFLQPAISDGVMLTQNEYDNQIYAFGQGPTAMTVQAPLSATGTGQSMVIQGTVTDQSPGAKGTPAISDQYMSQWMAYQYEQQPLPSTFPCDNAGVQVTVTATSSTGSTTTIGTVNSDSSGNFAIAWTPSATGMYIITASFSGSNSYYGSAAETHVVVGAVSSGATPSVSATPASPSPVTPPGTTPATTLYLVAAAIVVIIIVVIAAIALQRRRK